MTYANPAPRIDTYCIERVPSSTLTLYRCRQLGHAAAAANMLRHKRDAWNGEDFDIAVEVSLRHQVLGGHITEETYESHMGHSFGSAPSDLLT